MSLVSRALRRPLLGSRLERRERRPASDDRWVEGFICLGTSLLMTLKPGAQPASRSNSHLPKADRERALAAGITSIMGIGRYG